MFTEVTSHPSFISRKNLRSFFYDIFASIYKAPGVQYLRLILTFQQFSKILIFLRQERYNSLSFGKKTGAFTQIFSETSRSFQKHPLFYHFLNYFSQWYISNKYLLANKSVEKNIFIQATLHLSFISKMCQSLSQ